MSILRITPAYAGHTFAECICGTSGRDHPRLRGAYPARVVSEILEAGITPAYAGHTVVLQEAPLPDGDHPRLRGAYRKENQNMVSVTGSPPLTRGILQQDLGTECLSGITPAYAGHTSFRASLNLQRGDHPRLRGAYAYKGFIACASLGSPPLTRGIPFRCSVFSSSIGITPAYAGHTFSNCKR